VLRRYRPDFVLGFNYRDITVTGKWNTPDHRHTGRALLDAIGDAGNRWIFPDGVLVGGSCRALPCVLRPAVVVVKGGTSTAPEDGGAVSRGRKSESWPSTREDQLSMGD